MLDGRLILLPLDLPKFCFMIPKLITTYKHTHTHNIYIYIYIYICRKTDNNDPSGRNDL